MSPLCQSLGFRIQEKLGSILFLGLPLARRFQMDVWVEMSLDGQKQDMSCSDVFHVMNVALFVAGFCRHFPNDDPSDQRDDFGHHDEKDEVIHLKIYKIWGEQIKTFHVDLCPDVFMIMFLRCLLGSWMKLSWELDAEDDARHSVWTTLDTRPLAKGNTTKRVINQDLVVQEGVWKLTWRSVQLDT